MVNLTDSAGSKTADYSYKAFGEKRSQSGSVINPWLFTGRQLDSESGLYFYRNRYYDARAGRFITQDPSLTFNPQNRIIPYLLLKHISNPLDLHKYLYCLNNPTNLKDPFGLEPKQSHNFLRNAWNNMKDLFSTIDKFRESIPPGTPVYRRSSH